MSIYLAYLYKDINWLGNLSLPTHIKFFFVNSHWILTTLFNPHCSFPLGTWEKDARCKDYRRFGRRYRGSAWGKDPRNVVKRFGRRYRGFWGGGELFVLLYLADLGDWIPGIPGGGRKDRGLGNCTFIQRVKGRREVTGVTGIKARILKRVHNVCIFTS